MQCLYCLISYDYDTIQWLLTISFRTSSSTLKTMLFARSSVWNTMPMRLLLPSQRASITFVKNWIYQHKVLRINDTTYDMRREQDSLNPCTHANVMVLSQEDDPSAHPYWYARIIGIYHTNEQTYDIVLRRRRWQQKHACCKRAFKGRHHDWGLRSHKRATPCQTNRQRRRSGLRPSEEGCGELTCGSGPLRCMAVTSLNFLGTFLQYFHFVFN